MSKKEDPIWEQDDSGQDTTAIHDEWFEEPIEDPTQFEDETAEESVTSKSGSPKPPFHQLQGRKTWALLSLILIVIAVAVLYVYQAGDRKTVLGNQPIPAGQVTAPRGQNVPLGPNKAIVGGLGGAPGANGIPNIPSGGKLQVAQPAATPAPNSNRVGTVSCPRCGTCGVPTCATCGAVMQRLDTNSGLYACPVCGSVGVPICPRCGGQMASPANNPAQPAALTPGGAAGQFQCPSCGATGLPNWNANGTPFCPSCGAQMNVRSTNNVTLAARP